MGNVMLTGGNTMFEGLPQMLYKKLKSVRILLGWRFTNPEPRLTRLALAGRQGESRVAQDRGLKRPPDLCVGRRCAMPTSLPSPCPQSRDCKGSLLVHRVGAGFVANVGGGADHAGGLRGGGAGGAPAAVQCLSVRANGSPSGACGTGRAKAEHSGVVRRGWRVPARVKCKQHPVLAAASVQARSIASTWAEMTVAPHPSVTSSSLGVGWPFGSGVAVSWSLGGRSSAGAAFWSSAGSASPPGAGSSRPADSSRSWMPDRVPAGSVSPSSSTKIQPLVTEAPAGGMDGSWTCTNPSCVAMFAL